MAPTFITVSSEDLEVNIQDIQLEDTGNEAANIQILDDSGLFTEYYYWYKKRNDGNVGPSGYRIPCPDGKKGVWFEVTWNEDYTEPESYEVATKMFDWGDGFQLEIEEGSIIGFSGQVTDSDVFKTAEVTGYNYYANPYPTTLDIQAIQLADTGNEAANIQILDDSGLFTEYYYWYKKRNDGNVGPSGYRIPCPEGKNGVWFEVTWNEDYTEPEDYAVATKSFEAGDGFQLEIEEGSEFTIVAPFDL